MLFSWPNHKIITQSTLYKLDNYFKKNQWFKMDKRCQFIEISLLLPNEVMAGGQDQWCAWMNVQELCHQLCSIQFRCRDGSCFSQRNQNSICWSELYKLFDWEVYMMEQMLDTSIMEQNLNQQHKGLHEDSSRCKKALSSEGIIQIFPPGPSYMIEMHMPLSKTPRLDLYFTNSELTTVSLLAMACIEYLCKDENEYCFLHFKR